MSPSAVTAVAAGVLALGLVLLLAASVGDTNHTYNVQAWFAWQPLMLVVLVAELPNMTRTAYRWYAMVRHVLLLLAGGQAIGFIIWLSVAWSHAPAAAAGATLNAAPDNFYAIMIAALAVNAVIALSALGIVVKNDVAWWW